MKKIVVLTVVLLVSLFAIMVNGESGNVTRNKVSSLHVPVFKEWHGNTLWVFCKPNSNVLDPPIVYHDPTVQIISVSAYQMTRVAPYTYCVTFKKIGSYDCQSFILEIDRDYSSINWLVLDTDMLSNLAKDLTVLRR